MISNPGIEVQTTSETRYSVPAWFAEVVIIAGFLEKKGQFEAFHQVRLVRGRFGTYEPIDFLALLIGYAISGERRLPDFFERVECKIREETQQESGLKSSITEVYSTVLNSLWRQRGCYVTWNGQPFTT